MYVCERVYMCVRVCVRGTYNILSLSLSLSLFLSLSLSLSQSRLGKPLSSVTGGDREKTKRVVYAVIYGVGGWLKRNTTQHKTQFTRHMYGLIPFNFFW